MNTKFTLSGILAVLFIVFNFQQTGAQVKALEFFNGNSVRECKIFVPQEENPYFEDFQNQVLTVEMWVNFKPEAGSGVLISTKSQFVGDPANDNKSGGFEFQLEVNGWGRATYCTGNGGNSILWYNAQTVAGEWAHLAYVIDGANLTVYKNGEIAHETITFGGPVAEGLGDLVIGRNPNWDDGEFFQGQLTNIRIWKIARTQADIKNDMNIYYTKKKENLVASWAMQEGEGNVLGNIMHSSRNRAQVIMVNDMDQTGIRWIDSDCPVRSEGTSGVNNQIISLVDFKTYLNRESRTLTISSTKEMQVGIYGTDGKCYISKLLKQQGDIDLSNFSNGIYIINVSTEAGSIQEKIAL